MDATLIPENITFDAVLRKTRLGHQAVLSEPALPEIARRLLWRCNGYTPLAELAAPGETDLEVCDAAAWLLAQRLVERPPVSN